MDIEQLLERLEIAAQNPDLGIAFTNQELVNISFLLVTLMSETKDSIAAGQFKGDKGDTGADGVGEKGDKGDTGQDGVGLPGKDAVVTPEMLSDVATQATALIVLPDFNKLVEERIAANPLAVRDAVEVLPQDVIDIDSIDGLHDRLKELQDLILQNSRQAGGTSINKVLQLIADNTTNPEWGGIEGTLTDQTDLVAELDRREILSIAYAVAL
jgi:hypothetical protein